MSRPFRILFVCSRNRLRSPTAEAIFAHSEGVEVLSAGTASDAEERISLELVEWADLIVAMEARHRLQLVTLFGSELRATRIAVLGIPDDYAFMDPTLVDLLRQRVTPLLPGR